jgi:hypothetical protein
MAVAVGLTLVIGTFDGHWDLDAGSFLWIFDISNGMVQLGMDSAQWFLSIDTTKIGSNNGIDTGNWDFFARSNGIEF